MHTITLPALDGRHQLGFLAAVGLTRLISSHTDTDAKLCFDEHTAAAKLTSPLSDIHGIVTATQHIAKSIPTNGVLPDTRPDYPATATNEGADPAWHTRTDYRTSLTNASAAERCGHRPSSPTWPPKTDNESAETYSPSPQAKPTPAAFCATAQN